jgi:hypothetical protein
VVAEPSKYAQWNGHGAGRAIGGSQCMINWQVSRGCRRPSIGSYTDYKEIFY